MSVVFDLVDRVSPVVKNELNLLMNSKEEAEALSSKLEEIKIGLEDAEQQAVTKKNVESWLKKIEEVAYDIEDVFDEWKALQLQASEEDDSANLWEKIRSIVLNLCSSCEHLRVQRECTVRMKNLSDKVDNILKEKDKYNFVQGRGSSSKAHEEESRRVESTGVLDDSWVDVGGSVSKDSLVRKLVPEEEERSMGTQIVSIVGVGGIGKTTLAKLVYNHSKIESHFKLRAWVFVGDPFEPKKIARDILNVIDKDKSASYNSSALNVLVERIKEIVSKERFLLVLDDVWKDDRSRWGELMNGIMKGASGSRILMTTRDEKIATEMCCSKSNLQRLDLLSDEDCGMLLNAVALSKRDEKEKEKLGSIGMQIAKMCNGLPLAAKAVGRMLATKFTKREWKEVLESPLLNYEDKEIKNVFRILKLSYLDLDPILKRCLLSCVHFPHGYSTKLSELNNIWMTYGCLERSDNKEEVQRKAFKYANTLAMRSFFVKSTDGKEEDVEYKMHDIMHDFVLYMTGVEYTCVMMGMVSSGKVKRSHQENLSVDLLARLRYFSAVQVSIEEVPLISLLKCARLLTVRNCNLEELHSEIGKLIHLRNLDLSENLIKELPPEIGKFIHLRNLNLSQNSIKELPSQIGKLIQMRNLYLSRNSIKELPSEIGKLVHLWNLDLSRNLIKELPPEIGKLIQLRNLNLSANLIEVIPPEIGKLIDLRNLDLSGNSIKKIPLEIGNLIQLRYLKLGHNPIEELPTSITDLCNLHSLDVEGCGELVRLPEEIEKLRELRHLINHYAFSLRQFPEGLQKLTKLCTLHNFIAGEYGSKLGWLQNLNQLRGYLSIEIVDGDVNDAEKADLRSKIDIRDLVLYFSEDTRKKEEILEALRPPPEIETLRILFRYYYGEKWFPSWLMKSQLHKLKVLHFGGFKDCALPRLETLPCLEMLTLGKMEFKRLRTYELLGICSSPLVEAFPKLEEMQFLECEEWEEWEDIDEEEDAPESSIVSSSTIFPCLQRLLLYKCPNLKGLPHNLLWRAKSLQTLEIRGCSNLEARYNSESGASDYHYISHIPNIIIG